MFPTTAGTMSRLGPIPVGTWAHVRGKTRLALDFSLQTGASVSAELGTILPSFKIYFLFI